MSPGFLKDGDGRQGPRHAVYPQDENRVRSEELSLDHGIFSTNFRRGSRHVSRAVDKTGISPALTALRLQGG